MIVLTLLLIIASNGIAIANKWSHLKNGSKSIKHKDNLLGIVSNAKKSFYFRGNTNAASMTTTTSAQGQGSDFKNHLNERILSQRTAICSSNEDCSHNGCYGTCNDKNICSYSSSQCHDCHKSKISVEIMDDDPAPWTIYDELGETIHIESGSYEHNIVHEYSVCLGTGAYYFDGDRIETMYYGHIKIKVENETVKHIVAPNRYNEFFFEVMRCSTDADCNDNDKCTIDECNIETNHCSFTFNPSSECGVFGDKVTLVLRVIAADVESTNSIQALEDLFYGSYGKSYNMKSQLSACSYNQLRIVPFIGKTNTAYTIQGGVSEVIIPNNVVGEDQGAIVNAALIAANEKLGDLSTLTDLVMLCIPPGTKLGTSFEWKAYAYVNSYLSVYNDEWCSSPSVHIHEFGHNVGLSHSNDDENYGDHGCLMGGSSIKTDGPRMCFNGPKSWQLGWYGQTQMIFKKNTEFYKYPGYIDYISNYFDITGVSGYNPEERFFTIVKIPDSHDGYDYYVTFNHQSGINLETGEGANKVLVHSRPIGSYYADSKLLSILDEDDTYLIYHYLENSGFVKISPYWIHLDRSPAYANVYMVIYKTIECELDEQCDDFNSCTRDFCDDGECSHVQIDCAECGTSVSVSLLSNDFPNEISWDVKDVNRNRIVFSSGSLDKSNHKYFNSKCIEYGKYLFTVSYSKNSTLSSNVTYTLTTGNEVFEDTVFYQENEFFVICSSDEQCNDFDGCTDDICMKEDENHVCSNPTKTGDVCENCVFTSFNITLDNYPEETTWRLIDYITDDIIMDGKFYMLLIVVCLDKNILQFTSCGFIKFSIVSNATQIIDLFENYR